MFSISLINTISTLQIPILLTLLHDNKVLKKLYTEPEYIKPTILLFHSKMLLFLFNKKNKRLFFKQFIPLNVDWKLKFN